VGTSGCAGGEVSDTADHVGWQVVCQVTWEATYQTVLEAAWQAGWVVALQVAWEAA
jgi:hypothetical protein